MGPHRCCDCLGACDCGGEVVGTWPGAAGLARGEVCVGCGCTLPAWMRSGSSGDGSGRVGEESGLAGDGDEADVDFDDDVNDDVDGRVGVDYDCADELDVMRPRWEGAA